MHSNIWFCFQEVAAVAGKKSNPKVRNVKSLKTAESFQNPPKNRGRGKGVKSNFLKPASHMEKTRSQRAQKAEPLVKEEGEMSDDEEVYEQFKEVKWMEWCEDVMMDEERTLKRLQKLQTTSANLPKEKVDTIAFTVLNVKMMEVLSYHFRNMFPFLCRYCQRSESTCSFWAGE